MTVFVRYAAFMRFAFVCLVFATAAFAQINAISSNASRTVPLNPDEVTFYVNLVMDSATTLEGAAAVLQESGFAASDLLTVGSTPDYSGSAGRPGPARLGFLYSTTVPFSRMKTTLDKLEAARRKVLVDNGDLQYSLAISGSNAAIEQLRQKLIPELLAEARQKAEYLANVGKMRLGAIQTVGENSYPVAGGIVLPGGYYGGVPPTPPQGLRLTVSVYASWAATAQ